MMAPADATLRLAVLPADADALLELQKRALPWTHDEIENPIYWADFYTFVVEHDEKIVSSVTVRWTEPFYIFGLMTDPEQRRKGYAEYLIQSVLDSIEDNSIPIMLRVAHDNEPAQRLYKKLGFQFTGEVEYGNELVMRKVNRQTTNVAHNGSNAYRTDAA